MCHVHFPVLNLLDIIEVQSDPYIKMFSTSSQLTTYFIVQVQ